MRVVNYLSAILLWAAFGSAYAGLAADVEEARNNGTSVRDVIDRAVKAPDFNLDQYIQEVQAMTVDGPVALVYLVEHLAQHADEAVAKLAVSNVDQVIVAIVIAYNSGSSAACPLTQGAAKADSGGAVAVEAMVAVASEAPSSASAAMSCLAEIDPALAASASEAISDIIIPASGGGGGDDGGGPGDPPPVSPN